MEQTKKDFYETFNLGIEIEMETNAPKNDEESRRMSNTDLLKFKSDGSLKTTRGDTITIELISKIPWKKDETEQKFIEEMKAALPEFESTEKVPIFAYQNKTAGTHYHFSFKKHKDETLWIFDTKDFQKFFFKRYITTFKSRKFLDRIKNRYCHAPSLDPAFAKSSDIKDNLKNISVSTFNDEYSKMSSGRRYRWLNTECIAQGTGIELRIFPHIQTYIGLAKLNEFVKQTLLDYYWKPQTQERLKLLQFYNKKVAQTGIEYTKLNDFKRLIWDALNLEQYDPALRTGEIRLILADWCQKQPALICANDETL